MKFIIRSFIFTLFLGVNLSAYSLENDSNKPIDIESSSQEFDMETNTITLNGNVLITQGSIKIAADKVTIFRQEGKKEVIKASGSPVRFHQILDSGKPVDGQANRVHYDLGTEFLTLIDNAQLKQLDSSVKAEKITYDVKKQQLKAVRQGKGNRVKTVLIPLQLKDK
ncbi:lipopolysaccharide transport periplasmic protein LptA [Pasteurella atlantica]|uniref:Lipopolysaccharide transport periplasmic protein LptA n=2 Tax=Pasteurellaceae TaxID=712 RepID=A0ACC6HKE3_9PAST|nr:lipopolysaccharide transport periplasmic protein LptA [Pasteurella atlantica]MDP8033129.1 lipopolysaccharide transport periplasmic protein LptA [Pasteurella atlantica]MDP8035066.1 lipopolysaccharide transport periplasmic protein LptA [Pasteurella atlantica]MDP8036974.1 lipopolysaccharide transport periplasmic protein LptA [Pasteurella atlantica]MDP8047500.1 lipopolysaccharide transport periplasmic protein LptA [Pasteurella atlantica]MDP8049169.1 lipopolysaccharide transport periplasmic prot